MEIEYKVYNDLTREQINRLIARGKAIADVSNLSKKKKENEKKRKVFKKLEKMRKEIMSL